jgi:hypothetical protein
MSREGTRLAGRGRLLWIEIGSRSGCRSRSGLRQNIRVQIKIKTGVWVLIVIVIVIEIRIRKGVSPGVPGYPKSSRVSPGIPGSGPDRPRRAGTGCPRPDCPHPECPYPDARIGIATCHSVFPDPSSDFHFRFRNRITHCALAFRISNSVPRIPHPVFRIHAQPSLANFSQSAPGIECSRSVPPNSVPHGPSLSVRTTAPADANG